MVVINLDPLTNILILTKFEDSRGKTVAFTGQKLQKMTARDKDFRSFGMF